MRNKEFGDAYDSYERMGIELLRAYLVNRSASFRASVLLF